MKDMKDEGMEHFGGLVLHGKCVHSSFLQLFHCENMNI